MMISSSVYSRPLSYVWSPYSILFSVFIHFFAKPLLLFLRQFCFSYASFTMQADVYFFELSFSGEIIFAVLLKLVLCCYFKSTFSNNRLFVIYAILGSGMFSNIGLMLPSMILVNKRHLFKHSLACAFLFFCFYKCALSPIDLFAL